MPAQVKTYPLYIYNEPVTYNQFDGGINTNPSNEGLLPNELRNAVNVDYFNRTPKKRLGATKLLEMVYGEDIQKVQGVFLFTLGKPYIFVAANGKLYYSLYYPKTRVTLRELKIIYDEPFQDIVKYLGLPTYDSLIDQIDHTGYIYQDGDIDYLIFQNQRKIEAVSYKDKIYFTTGTRFIEVYLESGKLKASIVQPYAPNGIEYQSIGMNLLAAYPEYHVNTTEVDAVKTQIHFIKVTQILNEQGQDTGEFLLEAVMTYAAGKSANDYHFKWETIESGVVKPVGWPNNPIIFGAGHDGVNFISRGRQSITMTTAELEGKQVRCTFAEAFKTEPETVEISDTESYTDWVIDKITGAWFGSAGSTTPLMINTAQKSTWRTIHSCTKIISDGNKFLLYGDAYNSGEWFKTVIDNPGYITYRGGLNFKTNKNEELLKVIQFKGILVCFSFSPYSGGNISIVLGDGEDYNDGSGSYSPYYRKVVHHSITTDNGDTVQVAENVILFKYQDSVYMIEGSELNNEIISIQTVNTKLKNKTQDVNIPWEDTNCISEITQDYYALIWDEIRDFVDEEEVIIRPGIRMKMYFKNGYYEGNQVFFPWLMDKSRYFNTGFILQIAGVSTHLYQNLLVQYNEQVYDDLGNEFESFIRLKAVDLNYPKFTKYLTSMIIYYQRGFKEALNFTIRCYNEAGYLLLSAQVMDDKAFFEGKNITKARLGSSVIESKVINPKHKFPALLIDTLIYINSKSDFAMGSLTYNYAAVNTPDSTQADQYRKIIRVGEPMLITKESFMPQVNKVEEDQITIINAGGADEDYK